MQVEEKSYKQERFAQIFALFLTVSTTITFPSKQPRLEYFFFFTNQVKDTFPLFRKSSSPCQRSYIYASIPVSYSHEWWLCSSWIHCCRNVDIAYLLSDRMTETRGPVLIHFRGKEMDQWGVKGPDDTWNSNGWCVLCGGGKGDDWLCWDPLGGHSNRLGQGWTCDATEGSTERLLILCLSAAIASFDWCLGFH